MAYQPIYMPQVDFGESFRALAERRSREQMHADDLALRGEDLSLRREDHAAMRLMREQEKQRLTEQAARDAVERKRRRYADAVAKARSADQFYALTGEAPPVHPLSHSSTGKARKKLADEDAAQKARPQYVPPGDGEAMPEPEPTAKKPDVLGDLMAIEPPRKPQGALTDMRLDQIAAPLESDGDPGDVLGDLSAQPPQTEPPRIQQGALTSNIDDDPNVLGGTSPPSPQAAPRSESAQSLAPKLAAQPVSLPREEAEPADILGDLSLSPPRREPHAIKIGPAEDDVFIFDPNVYSDSLAPGARAVNDITDRTLKKIAVPTKSGEGFAVSPTKRALLQELADDAKTQMTVAVTPEQQLSVLKDLQSAISKTVMGQEAENAAAARARTIAANKPSPFETPAGSRAELSAIATASGEIAAAQRKVGTFLANQGYTDLTKGYASAMSSIKDIDDQLKTIIGQQLNPKEYVSSLSMFKTAAERVANRNFGDGPDADRARAEAFDSEIAQIRERLKTRPSLARAFGVVMPIVKQLQGGGVNVTPSEMRQLYYNLDGLVSSFGVRASELMGKPPEEQLSLYRDILAAGLKRGHQIGREQYMPRVAEIFLNQPGFGTYGLFGSDQGIRDLKAGLAQTLQMSGLNPEDGEVDALFEKFAPKSSGKAVIDLYADPATRTKERLTPKARISPQSPNHKGMLDPEGL